jgi:hypothetical protein
MKNLLLTGILTGTPDVPGKSYGKWVYQRTAAGHGNIPDDPTRTQQVRAWTAGTNPRTIQQVRNRVRFQAGVSAWHALTPEEKETYRQPGAKQGLNRFQYFMRLWVLHHDLPVGTIWDNGDTVWDAGVTMWDV